MTRASPQVLLLGTPAVAELEPVLAAVRTLVAEENLRRAADLRAAQRLTDVEEWFPDLIVVFQNWPHEFPGEDVLGLICLFPLARLVCCFGVWCDSDGRNQALWPPAVRVPAATAALRIERELQHLRGEIGATGAAAVLPLTASRTEAFEFDFAASPGKTHQKGPTADPAVRMAVVSPDRAWQRMMESWLKSCGHAVGDVGEERPLNAVLWDADPWDASQAARLRAFHERRPDAAVMAFLGFPRQDVVVEVQAAGAECVQPKLSCLAELDGCMNRVNLRSGH